MAWGLNPRNLEVSYGIGRENDPHTVEKLMNSSPRNECNGLDAKVWMHIMAQEAGRSDLAPFFLFVDDESSEER